MVVHTTECSCIQFIRGTTPHEASCYIQQAYLADHFLFLRSIELNPSVFERICRRCADRA